MLGIFLQSLLVGYSGAVMPGSLLTYTIDRSIKKGAKSGWIIITGHAFLELMVIAVIFSGGAGILASNSVQIFIGFAGGALLMWMGLTMLFDAWRNKVQIDISEQTIPHKREGSMLVGGVLLSASNPYFIVWWAVVGLGLIMTAYRMFGITGVVVFYIGHLLADYSWYGLVSFLISKSRHFLKQSVYRCIVAVLGCFLIFFGASFVLSAIKLLWY